MRDREVIYSHMLLSGRCERNVQRRARQTVQAGRSLAVHFVAQPPRGRTLSDPPGTLRGALLSIRVQSFNDEDASLG